MKWITEYDKGKYRVFDPDTASWWEYIAEFWLMNKERKTKEALKNRKK